MEEGQKLALALIPKITGLFSFAFSLMIVFTIARDKRRRQRTYDRLLLGMSLADVSSSLWIGLSTWPIPEESGAYWSIGNQATCNVQGFFVQLAIASPLYNGSLAMYYLLVTKYAWKEKDLKESWVSILFHAIPVTWGLATATTGEFLKLYNNANLWCWIAPAPALQRGMNANIYRWSFFYGPLWSTIVLVTICLGLVVFHVRKVTLTAESNIATSASFSKALPSPTLTKNKSGSIDCEFSDISDDDDDDYDDNDCQSREKSHYKVNAEPPEEQSLQKNGKKVTIAEQGDGGGGANTKQKQATDRLAKRRIQLTNQCIRYAVAFFITWLPITVRNLFWVRDFFFSSLRSSFFFGFYVVCPHYANLEASSAFQRVFSVFGIGCRLDSLSRTTKFYRLLVSEIRQGQTCGPQCRLVSMDDSHYRYLASSGQPK
jgi:hypothetical protein